MSLILYGQYSLKHHVRQNSLFLDLFARWLYFLVLFCYLFVCLLSLAIDCVTNHPKLSGLKQVISAPKPMGHLDSASGFRFTGISVVICDYFWSPVTTSKI